MIDSIPTIDGNKSFSKVDPINLKTIVKEARLTNLIKQKKERCNPDPPLIPQIDPPNLPRNDLLPPDEERGLGSRLIAVNGQYVRRSNRLYTQSFENGGSSH